MIVDHPYFPLRTQPAPEIEARELSWVLAWLIECDLATLEGLEMVSRTSKRDLRHQQAVCTAAIQQCFELNIEPRGLRGRQCGRVEERLVALAKLQSPAGEVANAGSDNAGARSLVLGSASTDSLFRDRVPAAAVAQIGTVLAWAAEYNLERLERLQGLKSASRYELNRQGTICNKVVQHCFELQVLPYGLMGARCERLIARYEALRPAEAESNDLSRTDRERSRG